MAMKKIKPQYGKVVAPVVNVQDEEEVKEGTDLIAEKPEVKTNQTVEPIKSESDDGKEKSFSRIMTDPNPFLQAKDVFAKAQLTKIGYRMRSEYVEILDIIKKVKKGGYTLEAVLDDALTYYFENSEDGREAIKKAEIFYP